MGKATKFASPKLILQITEEAREKAIASNSGGCLVADAIKEQYPQFTGITVDMATIRISDKKRGVRLTYLTPPSAQHCLLALDQGWPNPTQEVVLNNAVKIDPIKKRHPYAKHTEEAIEAWRASRIAELEEKEAQGTLLGHDGSVLTKMRKARDERVERPTGGGKAEVKVHPNGRTTVYGGTPAKLGPNHPNLLRGRDRHFGAKLADPGNAFREAVEQAVEQRLAESARSGE